MPPQLSTLTITQRSFTAGAVCSARAERARELATLLIERQGSAALLAEICEFIKEGSRARLSYTDGIFEIAVSVRESEVDVVPPGPYGLKGGAARERLFSALGVRSPRAPRDIDLIRKGGFAIASDDEVAARFMPRDYIHGARVELVREVKRYLATRDITLNEVGIFDSLAFSSVLAALDTIGFVIRPSYYRGGSIHRRPTLDGRVFLKMVRLAAEAEVFGDPVLLVGIPDQVSFSHFDLAVHLNKSFQRGIEVAKAFVNNLIALGAWPSSANPLGDLLAELEYLRFGEKGLLPDVPEGL